MGRCPEGSLSGARSELLPRSDEGAAGAGERCKRNLMSFKSQVTPRGLLRVRKNRAALYGAASGARGGTVEPQIQLPVARLN